MGVGWGTWIRTRTKRVRAARSTVKLSPNAEPGLYIIALLGRLGGLDITSICECVAEISERLQMRAIEWR